LINFTASSLNSRVNFRRSMLYLQFDKTPYLGVHQTGSRPNKRLFKIINTSVD